jgi:hypothetical protein
MKSQAYYAKKSNTASFMLLKHNPINIWLAKEFGNFRQLKSVLRNLWVMTQISSQSCREWVLKQFHESTYYHLTVI